MATERSTYQNAHRMVLEGTFDLGATGIVAPLSVDSNGIPKTVRGNGARVVSSGASAASLDLSTKTTDVADVIANANVGTGGNATTIAFVAGNPTPTTGTLVLTGHAYVFTFKDGVTLVSDFEALVTATPPGPDQLVVQTPSLAPTTAIAVTVDEFAATNLAGGTDTDGTYTVTWATASSIVGPAFQVVELLEADAHLIGATVATALGARVASQALDADGNVTATVITTGSDGAKAITSHTITVGVCLKAATARTGGVI